jgi:hypothetical protein
MSNNDPYPDGGRLAMFTLPQRSDLHYRRVTAEDDFTEHRE